LYNLSVDVRLTLKWFLNTQGGRVVERFNLAEISKQLSDESLI